MHVKSAAEWTNQCRLLLHTTFASSFLSTCCKFSIGAWSIREKNWIKQPAPYSYKFR